MRLVQLVYASEARNLEDSDGDVDQILEVSRKNNQARHISGLLCFSAERFIQCLEGTRVAVNSIYCKILNDPRHSSPYLLEYREIDSRDFDEWSMAYVGNTQVNRDLILKNSGSDVFDPAKMSGNSALLLLRDLASELRDWKPNAKQAVA